MTFKEKLFYKDYVDFACSNYKASTIDDEVCLRNIFSRAYYTMLLHCKDVLGVIHEKNDPSSHQKIINEILNSDVRDILRFFKAKRELADYNISRSFTVTTADVLNVQRTVKQILALDKNKLRNRN